MCHVFWAEGWLTFPGGKVALIVVDGLALDQWIVLRDVLASQRPQYRFHEDVVFAWVPTITSVSRQSIFAGTPPLFFPSSILTTHREKSLWTRFWMDQGLVAKEVDYAKGLGDGVYNDLPESLSQPGVRVLGLVVDKVDKIMHGMELGTAGMHNQVRQWASEGFMTQLLDMLFDCGFGVFLTSDHGNIEAQGCGRPSEGAMADLRGERVRIYPDPTLRSRVKKSFPNAVEWPAVGLPENCLTLLAPDRSAFIREGERIVGHGGISLEEVIVPMVRIERAADMKRGDQIGFSQRIQLDWLEYTANLVMAGNSRAEIVAALGERLQDKLSVGNDPKRGNRDKAITILTKVWVTVPQQHITLRDEGLELLRRSHTSDRILVHWCMCMATYPFFGTVAEATGRLMRLQGTVRAAQVQRRLREQLGERETVARAARRILRAFIDWGVLIETDEKGLYRASACCNIDSLPLATWAIKAALLSQNAEPRPAAALLSGPHLFPFDIALPPMRELEACGAFEIIHCGMDHQVLLGCPN